MDKGQIKKFAIWARNELIERVTQKAQQYGIESDECTDKAATVINGRALSKTEIEQRKALIERIAKYGYEQVIDEVAYMWFNRFIALRFMEVNQYLPTHVRVFTNDNDEFKPQLLSEALTVELSGLDRNIVFELKEQNRDEELYKYLLIYQCNELNSIMPRIFPKLEDYTELLLPDYLLRNGSVIEQMVTMIPESDWTNQVQIIGWLYQYYNSEPKDRIFEALKKNVKITKENIPAATQLFTPEWIVEYMVENSLGRLWLAGHPDMNLQNKWEHYIPEAEQEKDVDEKIALLRDEYKQIVPEEIKCIDPCCGSGHILSYMFDVLVKIYEAYGYSTREAVEYIVKNNIYGLDLDERAAQLAYFSIMMKARQYDRRFFAKNIQPNISVVLESNNITHDLIEKVANNDIEVKEIIESLICDLKDAKEYGSLIKVRMQNWQKVYLDIEQMEKNISLYSYQASIELLPLVRVGEILSQKYHIVVTNPPYMSNKGMTAKLSKFVQNNYPDSKSDLFACFIEQCMNMTKRNGYNAMITQHSWMFLSSYQKLREKMLLNETVNMAHLGARAFEEIGGEVVQTTAFVRRSGATINGYKGTYCRLIAANSEKGKEELFLQHNNEYNIAQDDFKKIPGSPIAYWENQAFFDSFSGILLGDVYETKKGMFTGNNDYFLKEWYEIAYNKFGHEFLSYNKGGGFRRWYGHNNVVVRWHNNGQEIKNSKGAGNINEEYYYKTCLSWNLVSTAPFCCRIVQENNVMGDAGPICLIEKDDKYYYYLLGYLNSSVCNSYMAVLNPTMNYPSGIVAKLPVTFDDEQLDIINKLVRECIEISRRDWDAVETSWGFQRNPLCVNEPNIEKAFLSWKRECENRFNQLKSNEEQLNKIFINIFDVEDVPWEVADENIEISSKHADLNSDIKDFISYAVGCMFGRYSLDVNGLAYAGDNWCDANYSTFIPDSDAIIPICDDEYFDDDIVGRFIKFVEVVYGKESHEENIQYIATALGGKGTPREVIRNYFINDFYTDHVKKYHKKPIYWLFDSGKKNGFKCLVYMHRYQPDTIARIRTDYVHEQQARYRTAIEGIGNRIENASGSDKVKLAKKLNTLKAQNDEIHIYEEKIHHLADQMISIDLDDGVKKNYEIFKDVLAKIK